MPRRSGKRRCSACKRFARVGKIEFIEHEQRRLLAKRWIPRGELAFDRRFVGEDFVQRLRAVEQMDEHTRTLDVSEKLVAEADSLVRAFDQARHVDHHERVLVGDAHDSELRLERRERIVGDLGARRRNDRKQRRFAGVGYADDAAIGEKSKLEPQRKPFAGLAAFGKTRRLPNARCEVLIAEPAAAAFCRQDACAGLAQIGRENRVRDRFAS